MIKEYPTQSGPTDHALCANRQVVGVVGKEGHHRAAGCARASGAVLETGLGQPLELPSVPRPVPLLDQWRSHLAPRHPSRNSTGLGGSQRLSLRRPSSNALSQILTAQLAVKCPSTTAPRCGWRRPTRQYSGPNAPSTPCDARTRCLGAYAASTLSRTTWASAASATSLATPVSPHQIRNDVRNPWGTASLRLNAFEREAIDPTA